MSETHGDARTLVGAIECYMQVIAQVQPSSARVHRAWLHDFSACWLTGNNPNALAAVRAHWIKAYVASTDQRDLATSVLRQFYAWAISSELIAGSLATPIIRILD